MQQTLLDETDSYSSTFGTPSPITEQRHLQRKLSRHSDHGESCAVSDLSQTELFVSFDKDFRTSYPLALDGELCGVFRELSGSSRLSTRRRP